MKKYILLLSQNEGMYADQAQLTGAILWLSENLDLY